ncbi:MAG: MarR family winged helix-turn-helix transcriptional regulator [Pseudomonadota bacterium]
MTETPLIDHIGWDLWRLTGHWKARYSAAMVAAGFHWYADARGNLMPLIGRDGVAQNDLVARAGMTKQAVQQHLDSLTRDGVITRVSDPGDARRKRIMFTAKGLASLDAANAIKAEIEDHYASLIGVERLKALQADLRVLSAAEEDSPIEPP